MYVHQTIPGTQTFLTSVSLRLAFEAVSLVTCARGLIQRWECFPRFSQS